MRQFLCRVLGCARGRVSLRPDDAALLRPGEGVRTTGGEAVAPALRVVIEAPVPGTWRTTWGVSLFLPGRPEGRAAESYAPMSRVGALLVADCLSRGVEPPRDYRSI
jgi:hypothetical protein